MAIAEGTTLLSSLLQDTFIFNVRWLLSGVATLLTLLIITRDVQRWKELAFPVMLGWHIAGLPPFFLLYILSAILYGIETLSLQALGQIVSAVRFTREPTITERTDRWVSRRQLAKKRGSVIQGYSEKQLLETIAGQKGRIIRTASEKIPAVKWSRNKNE